MKKKLIIILSLVITFVFVSCGRVDGYYSNKTFFDTTYNFNYAQIKMPDGTIVEGKVDSWLDFENSDQIQITINGETYLTHFINAVLISRKD